MEKMELNEQKGKGTWNTYMQIYIHTLFKIGKGNSVLCLIFQFGPQHKVSVVIANNA